MIFGVLSPYDLGGVVALFALLYGLARLREKKVTLGFGKGLITIEDVHHELADIKKTVGDPDGGGDVLARIDKIDEKVDAVTALLDERTHVTRQGNDEPEELAPYTQDRMHDVINLLTIVNLKVDTMWASMSDHGFDLPELPPMLLPNSPGENS